MSLYDWDTNSANNTSKPGIDWSEGMLPSAVNNSARQMMADLKAFLASPQFTGTAAFENLTVREIAGLVADQIPAEIAVEPDRSDPRSYRLCSDRLRGTGFAPKKNVAAAIGELAAAWRAGRLTDRPNWHTVSWMKQHHLG